MTPITPDNGITFLNNAQIVKNPLGQKTPPPPFWGEEESVNENFDTEPFYDPINDPGIDLRRRFHLDSKRALSTRRAVSDEKRQIADTLKYRTDDEEEIETIIVPGKRPHGSKLKKKIVYVYDSSDSDEDEKNSY